MAGGRRDDARARRGLDRRGCRRPSRRRSSRSTARGWRTAPSPSRRRPSARYEAEPPPDWPVGHLRDLQRRASIRHRRSDSASALVDRGLERRPDAPADRASDGHATRASRSVSPVGASLGSGPGWTRRSPMAAVASRSTSFASSSSAEGYQVLGARRRRRPVRARVGRARRHRQPRPRPDLEAAAADRRRDRVTRRADPGLARARLAAGRGRHRPRMALSAGRAPEGRPADSPDRGREDTQGALRRAWRRVPSTTMQTVPWTWDSVRSHRDPAGLSAFSGRVRSTSTAASARRSASPRARRSRARRRPSGAIAALSIAVRGAGFGRVVSVERRAGRGVRRPAAQGRRPVDIGRRGGAAALDGDGTAKLLVEDEDLIGTTVSLVVLDRGGHGGRPAA